jgi:hypothetical protein
LHSKGNITVAVFFFWLLHVQLHFFKYRSSGNFPQFFVFLIKNVSRCLLLELEFCKLRHIYTLLLLDQLVNIWQQQSDRDIYLMMSRLVCADRDNELTAVMYVGIRMRALVLLILCAEVERYPSFSLSPLHFDLVRWH